MKCAARGLICHVQTRYSASDEKEKWKKTHHKNKCLAAAHRAWSEQGALHRARRGVVTVMGSS